MRLLPLRLAAILLGQALTFFGHPSPGSAQGTDDSKLAPIQQDPVQQAPIQQAPINWEQDRFEDVREGYQLLQWNAIADAARYEVTDADDVSYFVGAQNEAFISGLPDGEHVFRVLAFSRDGVLIGECESPAVIVVRHWPITYAYVLLSFGAVVFVVMVAAIGIGQIRANRHAAASEAKP